MNGSGKTNILSAITLALDGRSFQGSIYDLVQRESRQTIVRPTFASSLGPVSASILIDTPQQTTQWGYHSDRLTRAKYLERVPYRSVILLPEELEYIIYGSPERRREWIDGLLDRCHSGFSAVKRRYREAVRQRNQLLKSLRDRSGDTGVLDLWDQSVVTAAEPYWEYRSHLLNALAQHITLPSNIGISLSSKLDTTRLSESLCAYLLTNRQRDIILGSTHAGPHTDDIAIEIVLPDRKIPTHEYLSR